MTELILLLTIVPLATYFLDLPFFIMIVCPLFIVSLLDHFGYMISGWGIYDYGLLTICLFCYWIVYHVAKQTKSTQSKKYYISTAIAYTNGSPHIGHSYEVIIADILARAKRLFNDKVFFLTGTDEHGQKIANTAKLLNIEPQDLCDKYVTEIKNLNDQLNISNNAFIRTTDQNHIDFACEVWSDMCNHEDIYFGRYTGWYSEKEEKFITEMEAANNNYLDIESQKPLIKCSEDSYFFKLSKYQQRIIDHINNNENFIMPFEYRTEILTRLTSEPLEDLSISRPTKSCSWGIPVPEDNDHVMYVWFDALLNYLSGTDDENGDDLWPASCQIIGKDIIWFHAVIWPAILMSLNFPLPKTILVHGFVNDNNNKKMSKSLGNVISPQTLLQQHNSDSLRAYLAYKTNVGSDISVSEDELIKFHNHHLGAKLGNLVHRTKCAVFKDSRGIIPNAQVIKLFSVTDLIKQMEKELTSYNIKNGLQIIFDHLDIVNKFVTDANGNKYVVNDKLCVIRTTLEALFILNHFILLYMPKTAIKIFDFLYVDIIDVNDLSWANLEPNCYELNDIAQLFPRIGDTKFEKKNNKK